MRTEQYNDSDRPGPLQGSQLPLSKEEEVKYRMTQGRPPLFTDMRIVNDEGQELPWDGRAAGELQVRGPHVIKAYFRVTFPSQARDFFLDPDDGFAINL